jgi:plasmid stabilization system protein ParE
VASVVYSRNALANLRRVLAFMLDDPHTAATAVSRIRSAVSLLEHHPFIGRPVQRELRELVISYGKTGFVALYRYVATRDEVRILAVRHQRELDY